MFLPRSARKSFTGERMDEISVLEVLATSALNNHVSYCCLLSIIKLPSPSRGRDKLLFLNILRKEIFISYRVLQ